MSLCPTTAKEFLKTETFLKIGDRIIDSLKCVSTGTITEIYGESGSGKSNFALQLCLHSQLPTEEGGLDGGISC